MLAILVVVLSKIYMKSYIDRTCIHVHYVYISCTIECTLLPQGTRYGMFVFELLNGNYMCTNGSLMIRKKCSVLFWMKEVVWYTFIIAIVTTLDKGSLCVCVCEVVFIFISQ